MDGSALFKPALCPAHSSGSDGPFNAGFPPPLTWTLLCPDIVLLFVCQPVALQNSRYLLQEGWLIFLFKVNKISLVFFSTRQAQNQFT